MNRCLIFFLFFYQANACLDLLVRSLNEVFSPMIETGEGRIRKPHKVDDLTNFYAIDQKGYVLPKIHHISASHPRNHIKSHQSYDNMLLGLRSGIPATNRLADEETSTIANTDTTKNGLQNIINPLFSAPESGVTKKYKNQRGYYMPGKRPFVDLVISLIETFQLGSDSKLITNRPRYENGQLHYET